MTTDLAQSPEPGSQPSSHRLAEVQRRAAMLHRNGRSAEASGLLIEALQEREPRGRSDRRLPASRSAVAYAEAARRPDLALTAAGLLREQLERSKSRRVRDELSDVLLLEAETAMMARAGERAIEAARRAVGLRRRAFGENGRLVARGRLIDALIALARHSLANQSDAAGLAALAEADAHLPADIPAETAWQARAAMVHRLRATLAQQQGRHADAIAAFEAALSRLPAEAAAADREAIALRLQLLVNLGRSRLALGQATEAVSDAGICHSLLAALEGAMPPAALEIVQAAVLANEGAAHARLGILPEAEAEFAAAFEIVERQARPDLADLRSRVMKEWAEVLRRRGRTSEAASLVALSEAAPPHLHGENCGCGEDHHHHAHAGDPHNHDHHGHDHHAPGHHAPGHHGHDHHVHGHHTHKHHHGAGCACCSHENPVAVAHG